MDWNDLAGLAADPNVTIGSATVNYPVLSHLKDADALREMTMGRAVAQAALHRDVGHFAYPFGDRAAFGRPLVAMAAEAGFASAASAILNASAEVSRMTRLGSSPDSNFGSERVATRSSFTIVPSSARIQSCDSRPPRSMATCFTADLLELRLERV